MDVFHDVNDGIYMVSFDITYKCNLKCLHCFNHSGERYEQELSDDEMVHIAREVAYLKPYILCLCGGEPLVRKELLYKITKEIKSISPLTNVNMVSNGMLITEEVAKKLKEAKLSNVQISLDGGSDETHNWLRNSTVSYERAVNAIKILRRQDLNVGVSFAPNKKNLGEVEKAIELCKKLGVKAFRVQPMMPMGRAGENLEKYILSEREYRILKRKLDKEKLNNGSMSIEWGDPTEHLARVRCSNIEHTYFLSIDPYGNIYVSPYLPINVGNLKKYSINEYWEAGLKYIWKNPVLERLSMIIKDAKYLNEGEKLLEILGLESTERIEFDIIEDKEKTEKISRLMSAIDKLELEKEV